MSEQKIDMEVKSAFYQFIKLSYSGRQLLNKHSLLETGVWQVRGKSSNCDMGGCHNEPYLFTAPGKLEDIICKAVNMPAFWADGDGGSITKLNFKNV